MPKIKKKAQILYFIEDPYACLVVYGIDPNLKGVRQEFTVVNGAWSAYYTDGVITFPPEDWRYRQSLDMELAIVDDYGDYNATIHHFLTKGETLDETSN